MGMIRLSLSSTTMAAVLIFIFFPSATNAFFESCSSCSPLSAATGSTGGANCQTGATCEPSRLREDNACTVSCTQPFAQPVYKSGLSWLTADKVNCTNGYYYANNKIIYPTLLNCKILPRCDQCSFTMSSTCPDGYSCTSSTQLETNPISNCTTFSCPNGYTASVTHSNGTVVRLDSTLTCASVNYQWKDYAGTFYANPQLTCAVFGTHPPTTTTPTSSTKIRIAVVGEGVIGLSTATAILDLAAENGISVSLEVFSDLEWEKTLSRGIAGLFRIDEGTHINRVYGNETFVRLAKLFREVGGDSGVQLVSGHIVSNNSAKLETQIKNYADIVYNFRFLTKREMKQLLVLTEEELETNSAIHYTAYTAEGANYCPYMKKQLELRGVLFHRQQINDLSELGATFDVVVNCAGLQGGNVAGDDSETYPIRGILLKTRAPWQKHFLYRDFGTYTIPTINYVFVGTVKQDNATATEVTDAEMEALWNRYKAVQPAFGNSVTYDKMEAFVGFRPGRKNIRVGSYQRTFSINGTEKKFLVVHNYGHGGNGFTLGWGSSLHAARLALSLPINQFTEAIMQDDIEKMG